MQRWLRMNTVLAAFLAIGSLAAADAANEQVLKLAKERVEILSQIHELTQKAYEQGSASLSELLEARASLLAARMDVCATKEGRVKVLEEMVKLAEQTQEMTERLVRAAEAPQYKALQAKANVLEIRIRLEREKAAP